MSLFLLDSRAFFYSCLIVNLFVSFDWKIQGELDTKLGAPTFVHGLIRYFHPEVYFFRVFQLVKLISIYHIFSSIYPNSF